HLAVWEVKMSFLPYCPLKFNLPYSGVSMIRPLGLFLLLLLVAGNVFPKPVALAEEPAGYRVSLFNGQNLEGWHALAECKAGVEDGVLVLQDGNGMLRTDHRYRDCILELECRARKTEAYDSGIYFRAE